MSIIQAWFTAESIRFRTRALRALFRDQRAELFAIWRHLQPGDIACDIGANKGVYSFFLARLCPRVHAFEPHPKLFPILKAAAAAATAVPVTIRRVRLVIMVTP